MPLKRRLAKHRADLPVQSWDDLTLGERAWLLGQPEPFGAPGWRYGEIWGLSNDPQKIALWRPGRPSASELREMFGDLVPDEE